VQAKLLNPAQGAEKLPKHLGVADLTDADILVKVLLPIFDSLPDAHAVRALEWVVSRWDVLKLNEEVCAALRKTEFVTAGRHPFVPAENQPGFHVSSVADCGGVRGLRVSGRGAGEV